MKEETKSFDSLWCDAEAISQNINKDNSSVSILQNITALCSLLQDSEESSKEAKEIIYNSVIGEILFLLTTLSFRENINVWKALKDQIDINK